MQPAARWGRRSRRRRERQASANLQVAVPDSVELADVSRAPEVGGDAVGHRECLCAGLVVLGLDEHALALPLRGGSIPIHFGSDTDAQRTTYQLNRTPPSSWPSRHVTTPQDDWRPRPTHRAPQTRGPPETARPRLIILGPVRRGVSAGAGPDQPATLSGSGGEVRPGGASAARRPRLSCVKGIQGPSLIDSRVALSHGYVYPMQLCELARQLGRPSQDVIEQLRAEGEWVQSHRSNVADPVARRLLAQSPPVKVPAPAGSAPDGPPPAPYTRPSAPRPRWRRRPGPRPLTKRQPSRDPYDDPIDDLRYEPEITTRDVADLFGVGAATVRQWVARGYLTPVGKLGPSNTFDTQDVMTATGAIEDRRKATGLRKSDRWYANLNPADRIAAKHYDLAVTPNQAASLVGVSPSTIRSWLHRGHLTRLPSSRPGAIQLRLGDVVNVARARTLPRRAPRTWPIL